jgi:hypothetical protein
MPARPSAPDSGSSTPILITFGAVPVEHAATNVMPAMTTTASIRAVLMDMSRLSRPPNMFEGPAVSILDPFT